MTAPNSGLAPGVRVSIYFGKCDYLYFAFRWTGPLTHAAILHAYPYMVWARSREKVRTANWLSGQVF